MSPHTAFKKLEGYLPMPIEKNKHWRLSMPGIRSWKITYWCPRANQWQRLLRRAELFPNPSRNLPFASLDGLKSKSTFSELASNMKRMYFQAPNFRSWLVLSEHRDRISSPKRRMMTRPQAFLAAK